jgi:hypothetical protein
MVLLLFVLAQLKAIVSFSVVKVLIEFLPVRP